MLYRAKAYLQRPGHDEGAPIGEVELEVTKGELVEGAAVKFEYEGRTELGRVDYMEQPEGGLPVVLIKQSSGG